MLVKGGKYRALIRGCIKGTLLLTVANKQPPTGRFVAADGEKNVASEGYQGATVRSLTPPPPPTPTPPRSLYFRGGEAFQGSLSGFSKFAEGRPPSLFSPPNFVVHGVDRQRAVHRRTRGGNRNRTAGSGHNHLFTLLSPLHSSPPSLRRAPRAGGVESALARTHTRVALCPVSRTQLGWVSAFNPLGGGRSLSRKACIHLRPRKAVGFVSGCNRLRTTADQAVDRQTDGWTGLTAADSPPTPLAPPPRSRFPLALSPDPLPVLGLPLLRTDPPRQTSCAGELRIHLPPLSFSPPSISPCRCLGFCLPLCSPLCFFVSLRSSLYVASPVSLHPIAACNRGEQFPGRV